MVESIELSNLQLPYSKDKKPHRPHVVRCLVLPVIYVTCMYLTYSHSEDMKQYKFLSETLFGAFTSCLAQTFFQAYRGQFSANRQFKFFIWGAVNALLNVNWIAFLISSTDAKKWRILLDSFVGTPVFQMIYIVYNSLWDRSNVMNAVKTHYLSHLKMSLVIWPAVSVLCFCFLEGSQIFLFSCLVNLVWGMILAVLS